MDLSSSGRPFGLCIFLFLTISSHNGSFATETEPQDTVTGVDQGMSQCAKKIDSRNMFEYWITVDQKLPRKLLFERTLKLIWHYVQQIS